MKKLLKLTLATLVTLCGLVATSCSDEDSKGGIHGVAVDAENQEPMRGVNVQLCKQSGTILESTVTYDDGHFEFTDVNPGEYTVIISSTKYPNVKYDFSVQAGRTASFDVPMGLHTNPYMPIYMAFEKWGEQIRLKVNIPGISNISVLDRGVYLSEIPNPASTGEIIRTNSIAEANEWNFYFYGDYSTMYYAQAYMKDDKGNIYLSEIIKVVITPRTPSVRTISVKTINESKATLEGEITHRGNPVYSERGFIVSTEHTNPTISDVDDSATKKYPVQGEEMTFKYQLTEFDSNKQYYVRAYAINNIGIAYGIVKGLNTDEALYYTIGNLMIQQEDIGSELTWAAADIMCKNSRDGGFSDWQLPSITECAIMYNDKTRLELMDANYWTRDDGETRYPYYYTMSSGKSGYAVSSNLFRARCVRTN